MTDLLKHLRETTKAAKEKPLPPLIGPLTKEQRYQSFFENLLMRMLERANLGLDCLESENVFIDVDEIDYFENRMTKYLEPKGICFKISTMGDPEDDYGYMFKVSLCWREKGFCANGADHGE